VAEFNGRAVTLDRTAGRSRSSRFGGLGDRLARAFSTQSSREADHVDHSVDEHLAELEQQLLARDRELAELRARTPLKAEIAAEIERIGEQTSAVLIAAHDQAQETTRVAQERADRCVADAVANASAITSEANRQLRELESEKTSLGRERQRLLEDVRVVAAALSSLADDAAERFPPG
jgi:DivIVA protein